jgi:hypothetical protein
MMLSVMACQKEKSIITPDAPSTPSPAFTAGTGSYFVYNIFEIDSNGQETPFGIPDTIFVVGDTLLNGHRFVHLKDQWFNIGQISTFLRDSSGYIVDTSGMVQWANRNLTDTVTFRSSEFSVAFHTFGYTNRTFVLPSGSVNGNTIAANSQAAFELQMHSYLTNGERMSVCDSGLVQKKLFVYGIGTVSSQLAWVGAHYGSCKYYERRLIYYSILP